MFIKIYDGNLRYRIDLKRGKSIKTKINMVKNTVGNSYILYKSNL